MLFVGLRDEKVSKTPLRRRRFSRVQTVLQQSRVASRKLCRAGAAAAAASSAVGLLATQCRDAA